MITHARLLLVDVAHKRGVNICSTGPGNHVLVIDVKVFPRPAFKLTQVDSREFGDLWKRLDKIALLPQYLQSLQSLLRGSGIG